MRTNPTNYILAMVAVLMAILITVWLWPRKDTSDNFQEISGKVYNVTKGKNNDIVLSLEKMRDIYYIGKGIQKGLYVDSLKKQLIGTNVTLLCAKPNIFMRFGPMVNTIQIYSISDNGKIVFSEHYPSR